MSVAKVVTTIQSKGVPSANNRPAYGLAVIRILILCFIYLCYHHTNSIQIAIDVVWEWLRKQWWYESVYNETVLVQVYSFPAIFPYRLIYALDIGNEYKIDKTGGNYELPSYSEIITDVVDYTVPLFLLDTFHVKHYAGVPLAVINDKRKNWIQTTRALPECAPLVGDMVRHLLIGLVIYDACFFWQHFLFHKNAKLFKLFHKKHHVHDAVNARVTNRLHSVERIVLVLSANLGLKIQGAHPLTRTLFIFVFISLLVDNHSGYDFPYSYDKILPKGLIGGSKAHFDHHQYGVRNYQPIFTYLDSFVEWFSKKYK